MIKFSDLTGKILKKIYLDKNCGDDHIYFETYEGEIYVMYHYQHCCESVEIEELIGDLKDLIGTPLLVAEERVSHGDTDWGTETWSFYEVRTIKGSVTLRWHGQSNGYYSESVDFETTDCIPATLTEYILFDEWGKHVIV